MKPEVFNYADYVKLNGECVRLKAENEALNAMLETMNMDIITVKGENAELRAENKELKALSVNWHEIHTRPLTDEEKEEYAENYIPEYIFDCDMPEDGQEILIATKWGVDKDVCSNDWDYGIGLEGLGDFDEVFAWAEMPKYKEEE